MRLFRDRRAIEGILMVKKITSDREILKRRIAAKKRPKINSRNKGASGERELAQYLETHGISARRGQQFSGGSDSPDVVTELSGIHFECKRVEAGNLYNWLDQASRDAANKIPVVAHRRNNRQWVSILNLDDFLNYFTGDFR